MKEWIKKLRKICDKKVESLTARDIERLAMSTPLLIAEITRLAKDNERLRRERTRTDKEV